MVIIVFLKSKPVAIGALFLAVACFFTPCVQTVQYLNYLGHKNQVVVNHIDYKGPSGNSDKLLFEADVDFKNHEVSNVRIDTLVYEENTYLGAMSCHFEGNKLDRSCSGNVCTERNYFEKNTHQTLRFSITPGYEDALYYTVVQKADSLTFRPSVPYVGFSDGISVGSFDYYYDEGGGIHYR